jgi:heme exporter protein D
MDLGPHATFIVASYAVTAVVIGGLVIWLFVDGAHQRRLLEDLEARGARRRSRSNGASKKPVE